MTEQRKQILQREVISTKQPSHKAMIILSVKYHLKLQLVVHTRVTQINLAHLSMPDINFNPYCSEQIQTQNLIHFQRNQPDRNGLVLYICQDISINV